MGKLRLEENRGKAGHKENKNILHIIIYKIRNGSYKQEQLRE